MELIFSLPSVHDRDTDDDGDLGLEVVLVEGRMPYDWIFSEDVPTLLRAKVDLRARLVSLKTGKVRATALRCERMSWGHHFSRVYSLRGMLPWVSPYRNEDLFYLLEKAALGVLADLQRRL